MPIQYDASIIAAHAEQLYRRANSKLSLVFGLLLGPYVAALFFGSTLRLLGAQSMSGEETEILEMLAVVFGAPLGALAGHAIGRQRGHNLRFQAQLALCAMQMEVNTRSESASR